MLALVARAAVLAALLAVLATSVAVANTSHKGWPAIDGMLLMNKLDGERPLDARPGMDPFGGADRHYRCDQVHKSQHCLHGYAKCTARPNRHGRCDHWINRETYQHNELLGGHGSDTIYAGLAGDVIWGDYKPSGQPTRQRDAIFGGPGRDFIYASHGRNAIDAGPGDDWIKAHFGRGSIDCGPGRDLLFVSRRAQKHYDIRGCEQISHRTLGY